MILFIFFNDTATTEIYTLSLHDALPISNGLADRPPLSGSAPEPGTGLYGDARPSAGCNCGVSEGDRGVSDGGAERAQDRKSTRLNSSHSQISYAVFCLKKKKTTSTQARNAKEQDQAYPSSWPTLPATPSLRHQVSPRSDARVRRELAA